MIHSLMNSKNTCITTSQVKKELHQALQRPSFHPVPNTVAFLLHRMSTVLNFMVATSPDFFIVLLPKCVLPYHNSFLLHFCSCCFLNIPFQPLNLQDHSPWLSYNFMMKIPGCLTYSVSHSPRFCRWHIYSTVQLVPLSYFFFFLHFSNSPEAWSDSGLISLARL